MHLTVIGAGIVGLATALKLKEKIPGIDITILEKENDIAQHQTGNNSGVIHSGIYYKPGSLKARNCISGYKMLLEFCDNHNIEYNLCGKVIVATEQNELEYLETLYQRGIKNGLGNLLKLDERELKKYEPYVNGIAGIHVPQTGIIDYKVVAQKMKELLIADGVKIFFDEEVKHIFNIGNKKEVRTKNKIFNTDFVISCAGLQADRVAALTEKNLNVKIIPFRGEYYRLTKEARHFVKTLIYPVPDSNFPFLGVHFTNLINGGVEAGPNAVFSFKREGYSKTDFDLKDTFEAFTWPGFLKVAKEYWRIGLSEFYRSFSKKAFVTALQKLIPQIEKNNLEPGGAGIRAQACDKNGGLIDDFFLIERENIIHLLNAPSPAATASLAIGEYIAIKVLEKTNENSSVN
jgi:L-2-hydroxyglutarate oxidase